jgi:hypothetical protein
MDIGRNLYDLKIRPFGSPSMHAGIKDAQRVSPGMSDTSIGKVPFGKGLHIIF